MPRKPRMYLAGIPCHVIQRGNNRNACFFAENNYRMYLDYLQDACRRYHVAIHAYVLMSNHVHLLMTPDDSSGISRVMQSLGRRYVQQINTRYRRTGTLWEGRHKSSLVDTDKYFLTCMRYIELNPVRAGMVHHPREYRWSSYRANAETEIDTFMTHHSVYLALGNNSSKHQNAYRCLFDDEIDDNDLENIRKAIQFSEPLGTDRFKRQLSNTLNVARGNIGTAWN
jgi:putative transposase